MDSDASITRSSGSIPQCCCGSSNCAYLAHNGKLLEGLERDVSKAAQLGQALLIRHENYVADSERERNHMLSTIESLERDKLDLEARNAQTIKENRELLDQLEQLNDAVAASDAHVQALTDTLHSTEDEIQRLGLLAARTQLLEQQLLELEREQILLQTSLELKTSDEKTAVQRWKTAEATIASLQDQIDRIEREAREEHERHVEVVSRMERRMALEGELAARGVPKGGSGVERGPNVVSHFVKDILLDNANLQHGILELREMLLTSNEEVSRLREQLQMHQPVTSTPDDAVSPAAATPSLQKELGSEPVFNQELHIHHHYHGGPPASNPTKPHPPRRPKKKRFGPTPGNFAPASADLGAHAAIMSQTAVTIPNTHRWSNATTLTPSLPSSPLSTSHRGSIYDRVFSDAQDDSSRPTSPSDSTDMQSPTFGPSKMYGPTDVLHHRKKSHSLKPPSLSTIRSVSTPISITSKSSPATAVISAVSPANSLANDVFTLSPAIQPQDVIPEENEDLTLPSASTESNQQPHYNEDIESLASPMTQTRPMLRRAASHESLISVSGMDIHTLRSRPSQLLMSASPYFGALGGGSSARPELTPWTATATGNTGRRQLDSSTLNRSLLYSSLSTPHRRHPGGSGETTPRARQTSGLTMKLGEWVFGKWGATPTPSRPSLSAAPPASPIDASSPRPTSSKSAETQSSTDTAGRGQKKAKDNKVKLRPAGVNQSGPIQGFFDIPETPAKVHVEEFDAEALGEALAE